MVRIWIMAARLRTLPAAIAPVLVGTALAGTEGRFRVGGFIAALLGAIFIQVGTNLSNDYSDARRGADTEERLGPVRVTAGGLVPPRKVLIATWLAFGIAVAAGIYLVAIAGWELLVVGAASIAAGELFVFGFFGIVAVVGSYYVQVEELRGLAFTLAVPIGLLAAAILMVNNIRDIETDRRAGKRTLGVRLGRRRARRLFAAMVYVPFLWATVVAIASGRLELLLIWLSFAFAPSLVRTVATRTDGPSLNRSLAEAGRLLAAFSVLLSVGLLLS